MELVEKKIELERLKEMSHKMFGSLVKAVVDIQKEIMVVDAEMHVDQEEFMLERGSEQDFLWGINLYPDQFGTDDWIVFDSMINLRPAWGNKTRSVENAEIRKKIVATVNKLVQP